jgi:hypothetical protein
LKLKAKWLRKNTKNLQALKIGSIARICSGFGGLTLYMILPRSLRSVSTFAIRMPDLKQTLSISGLERPHGSVAQIG